MIAFDTNKSKKFLNDNQNEYKRFLDTQKIIRNVDEIHIIDINKKILYTSLNDDLTESVTDNAKRKYKKLQRNIEKFFNAKENIEQDDNKLLDQEYLDI